MKLFPKRGALLDCDAPPSRLLLFLFSCLCFAFLFFRPAAAYYFFSMERESFFETSGTAEGSF